MELKMVDYLPQDNTHEGISDDSAVNGSLFQSSFQQISAWMRRRKGTEQRRNSLSAITTDVQKEHTPTLFGVNITPIPRSNSHAGLTNNYICLDFHSAFVQNLCFSISSVPNPLEIYGRFNAFQPYRFTWLKDGRPVVTTENISVSFSVHSSLLRVNRPEQDSSGIYTCIVFHSLGRSQASICILISPDPDEDEEIEEIRDICSDGLDDPHPMDYRPIYRPSVLGTSNTTQRMVWNTKNFSGSSSPVSPSTTINGFLPTCTSTDSASGRPIKPRTISVIKSSPSPELNTEPAPVRDRDTKLGEDEQTERGVKTTDVEAKARTDSPIKSAYFSWLPKMFRRKKAVVKNSTEQLSSKGSMQMPSSETKPASPSIPSTVNDASVPEETTGNSSPRKMVSRMVSSLGTTSCTETQSRNPPTISHEPLTGNEKIDSSKNSDFPSTSEEGLRTAAFQSSLTDLPTEVNSRIYSKRSQSPSISSGMEESSESVGTTTSTEEESAHQHRKSTEVKLNQTGGFLPVNYNVEVIPPIVVSVVNCANEENEVKPVTVDPMQLAVSDDESSYTSDVDRPQRRKQEKCKPPTFVNKQYNICLQPTLDERTAPDSSIRPVKSSDDMTDGGGSSVFCDDPARTSEELSQSTSSILSQTKSDQPPKRLPPTDFPDRAHSYNAIQSCDNADDRDELVTKRLFKKNSEAGIIREPEWFSLGSKRRSMLKKSKYGTAEGASFPFARSHGGLNFSSPKVSIKRKRDLVLLDGEPQRWLSSQSTGSAITSNLSEADSLKVSAIFSEVDSNEPQSPKENQPQVINPPLLHEEPPIEPVLVNGASAEVPVPSTVLKRPDFEGAHLRTDHEGEWTGPNRSRLEGVQLLVAKYEQAAAPTSSVESLTDSGVCRSTAENQQSEQMIEGNEEYKKSVPSLSLAASNQRTEVEQLSTLKSPPAVDKRRKRESSLSVQPTEENCVAVSVGQPPSQASVHNTPISPESRKGSQVGTSPSQMKPPEGKTKQEMASAPRAPLVSEHPNSPRVSQPIRVALSQTRAGSIEKETKKVSTHIQPVIADLKNVPQVPPVESKPADRPAEKPLLKSLADLVSPELYQKHVSEASYMQSKKITRGSMVSKRPNLDHKEEMKNFTTDPETHRNIDPKRDYEIMEQLGKGKFGRVNRCQKKGTEEVLAMKVVRMAKLRRDEHGDVMEVAILRAIGYHDSIACLYSAYEYKNECYIVSEYVSGGALYDRIIAEDNLDEKICASIIRQLLLGLQHIQRCSVLHLDLKPENVMMVKPTGYRLKIIDFGLACFHNPSKPSRSVGGTFTYSAPETINYDYQHFSTDTWSIGVIAYEVLSGITPFEIPQTGDPDRELSMAEVTTNIINCRYNFDDQGICDATEMAKDFIRSILKKNPTERPTVESCLKHEWMMTSEDLPTVKRTVSLRRRNTAKERVRPGRYERSQTVVEPDEVWRT